MNKIHRTGWSEARQCFVVASETAKARGKASCASAVAAPAVVAALLALGSGQAMATACGVLNPSTTTTISSPTNGPCTLSGSSVLDVANTGTIIGGADGVVVPGGTTGTRVTNAGMITGTARGVWVDPFNGGGQIVALVNAAGGVITGTSAYGLVSNGTSSKINDISNAGTLQGAVNAIRIYSSNMTGCVVNAAGGLIDGTATTGMGINITNGSRFVSFNNAGSVSGGVNGAAVYISQSSISGGIINSGSINGKSGLFVSASVGGGVTNSGQIEGTSSSFPGLNLVYGTITGNVHNSGASAVILGVKTGLALTTLSMVSGAIINGGLIQGQAASGFGVNLAGLTGSPGFTNSGTILGATALSSDSATVLPTIQNLPGALISGMLSLSSATTLSNSGTVSLPTATVSFMAGSFNQSSTGVFRTGVTSTSSLGKLRVSGTVTLPANANFDVVTVVPSSCSGITAGGTIAGVITATGTLTWDNTYTVTDNCDNLNFEARRNAGNTKVIDLVAVVPPASVSGGCGTASGLASAFVPNAGLCTTGIPSLVTATAGGYNWSCTGTGGGNTAQCSAPGVTASGGTGTYRSTFELASGTGCVVRRASVQPPPSGGPGNNVQMPYGVLDFTLEDCTASMARVRMTYSASIEGMQFYKYVNANWVQLTTVSALNDSRDGEVVISGNTATFNIRDNGAYDADSTTGVIVDPGGPGFAPSATDPQSIPTLSEWGLIALTGLMGLFGLRQMRRRGTNSRLV